MGTDAADCDSVAVEGGAAAVEGDAAGVEGDDAVAVEASVTDINNIVTLAFILIRLIFLCHS